ncbi:MAG: 4'-phosphopantetheinyl transferase superfamily protein [Bacteroidetes bacterium]|nr:4'-phosphopantetheinyl transferase superfamily protein [Bacteroidota bacterium]
MKIYAVNISIGVSKEDFDRVIKLLTTQQKDKICSFRNYEDSLRALFSRLLCDFVLQNEYPLNTKPFLIAETTFGKPYLENHKNIKFNISHSGHWVVCAVSHQEIGIDVEQVRNIDLDIAQHYFSESERNDLLVQPLVKQMDYFYRLWTLKESYIKMLGEGLSCPLDSFSVVMNGEPYLIDKTQQKLPFTLQEIFIEPDYKLAVCSSEKSLFPITIIDSNQLVQISINNRQQK